MQLYSKDQTTPKAATRIQIKSKKININNFLSCFSIVLSLCKSLLEHYRASTLPCANLTVGWNCYLRI